MRTRREVRAPELARNWLDEVMPPAAVRIHVDVDPYSFL
jgi:hypothetical protein